MANDTRIAEINYPNTLNTYAEEVCGMVFHWVCPPGSSGEGIYHYIIRDCGTGKVIGQGWYGEGCIDDEDGDDPGGGVVP